ncbi:MAG TPA: hypothetical protein VNH84_12385 [Candidatus Saccharimonadales bacterium]|nr:hypothetical protein [Candidatus Saccharimonadales bacterium]
MSSPPSTSWPLQLLLPLGSALVYVLGALVLKRATELGAGVWRTVQVCNFITALLFTPLMLLGGTIPSWQLCWQPAVAAALFTAGQVFTLLALSVGEVSVATPVLGLKVPLVAFLTTALLSAPVGARLWTAALLSSAAIALLNVGRTHARHRIGATVVLAALAALAYALFDVLVQRWSPSWGAGRFLPLTMACAAAVSLTFRLFDRSGDRAGNANPGPVRRWRLAGAVCLALQAIMFICAIALYGQATVANVLYSSRGLWSVLAVWLVGRWFANPERHLGTRVLAWRFIGAALLMVAILLVLLDGQHGTR